MALTLPPFSTERASPAGSKPKEEPADIGGMGIGGMGVSAIGAIGIGGMDIRSAAGNRAIGTGGISIVVIGIVLRVPQPWMTPLFGIILIIF